MRKNGIEMHLVFRSYYMLQELLRKKREAGLGPKCVDEGFKIHFTLFI